MIQIARQTQTSLPTDLEEDADNGEEMVLDDRQTQPSIASEDTTRDAAESVSVNSESYVIIARSSNGSSGRKVGLITPLESAASIDEAVGSATENPTGLNSVSVTTNHSTNSRGQQSTATGSSKAMVLSARSESHDWDNKWNSVPAVTPSSVSTSAKTPRSSNLKNVHCKWDNRCGSPVKVSCNNNWEAITAVPVTSTTKNGMSNPRERTRSCNETPAIEPPRHNSRGNSTSVPTVTPRRLLSKLQEKPAHDTAQITAESPTSPPSPRRIVRTRRLKSDTTATAWSATIDRSPRVIPRHRSAADVCSTRSISTQTEPSRSWSIFDASGHFCTCTACASIVLQTSLQQKEFYKHQQRRCCRGQFEKEIADLVADINKFGYDDEEFDDTVIMARTSRIYSCRGDALLELASPLRELSILCLDVRNIHAIRLFGGVQAVVRAMNALRKQASEHLQLRQRQQQCENISHSADDECYSTALGYGCLVLQHVAREHAQSNSSSSPGTFAHRISLVMLLSVGGSGTNSNSGVHGIVQAMKLFPLDHALQQTGTRALMNLSNSSRDACQAILDAAFSNDNGGGNGAGNECGYSGIVEELVTAIENFPHCPSIKESALVTLCNLFEKVPDAAMKQLAPRRETSTPPAKHEPVVTQNDPPKRRLRSPKESKAATTTADNEVLLSITSKHPPTGVSADSCSHSIGEISAITACTTTRITTPPRTKNSKECTTTTPPPCPPAAAAVVSSPRAIVKVEDITHLLDGVLRLGPKRHYHDENTGTRSSDDGDDDSEDDAAAALWNRVYQLEQRLLIGEVLENVFHRHPRLCFQDEKKCDM
jgi:hypothetical protein